MIIECLEMRNKWDGPKQLIESDIKQISELLIYVLRKKRSFDPSRNWPHEIYYRFRNVQISPNLWSAFQDMLFSSNSHVEYSGDNCV